jgi:hypothetical protein
MVATSETREKSSVALEAHSLYPGEDRARCCAVLGRLTLVNLRPTAKLDGILFAESRHVAVPDTPTDF